MRKRAFREFSILASVGASIAAFATPTTVLAQQAQGRSYDIPAQDLGAALEAFGRQSGKDIMFDRTIMAGKRSKAINGPLDAATALRRLLEGTGFSVRDINNNAVVVERKAAKKPEIEAVSDIVVTGSRIRGAPIASQVIVQSQEQMKDAGQNTLADVIRVIPQNFGGGQNPGISGGVPEANGVNTGAGTSINLRGLGSDATLTLLNGHRLPYNVNNQAIDISSIPLAAVDRIEIVADGASALYGSDAVAGVANIILKRDYQGVSTTARFGASTDGGNRQQQYSVVAGTTWRAGGVIATYDFEKDTPIVARQRDYTANRSPGLTLFPALKRHSVMLSGHQIIVPNLEMAFDAIYNKRWSDRVYALNSAGDYRISGRAGFGESESFVVAPSLKLDLSGQWRASLSAMYGIDRSHYGSDTYSASALRSRTRGCYCNAAKSVELNVDGDVLRLPGGDLKVAAGGGFRSNDFHAFRTVGAAQNIKVSQDTYYAFGEVSLPLISPAQDISFVNRLNVSGAIRYEDYPGVDRVFTPKFGLIYSPSQDLDIKASWGRSFKAPTLYQRYSGSFVEVDVADYYGSPIPGATALFISGSNADLKPERATTWAVTVSAHPRSIDGLRVEVSYFDIAYRDRIVSPITYSSQALSNPIYADLVNFAPTADQANAALIGRTVFNYVGGPFNPNDVVAIINSSNLNVSRQSIRGADISIGYEMDTNSFGTFDFQADASYLQSTQRLSEFQPDLDRAGTLFNPPHFRARGGVTWKHQALTMSSFVSYMGGVDDIRRTPSVRVGSMTTADVTARYKVDGNSGILRGLDFIVSVQNIFNDKPSVIRTSSGLEAPYDSTNYSAVGRFVSFGITKQW